MVETPEEQVYTDADYLRDTAGFLHTLSSMFFLELTQEQIDALRAIDFAAMDAEGTDPLAAAGFKELARYLNRAGVNVRQDLACEYAKIFLGAGISEGLLACPFESVFTSPEGIMMQDSRDDAVRIYTMNGMAVDQDLNTPEDHLSFELDFCAYMAERTADALDAGEDASALLATQISFVENHLQNWLPQLTERVNEYAQCAFYPAIMKITMGTIADYRAALETM